MIHSHKGRRADGSVVCTSGGKKSGSFVKDLMLGGTSGCIAKTSCAPLERVKIVLQTQAAAQLPPGAGYKGMLDCGMGIMKENGVVALWRGNFVNCVRYFPTQAIGFACKEKYQSFFVRPKEEVGFARWFAGYLAAGGCAGATALTFVYPLEFAYTRLAADTTGKFNGLGGCVSSILSGILTFLPQDLATILGEKT